jgi:hypothetical protein
MIGGSVVIGLVMSQSLALVVWVCLWWIEQRVGSRVLVMRRCPLHCVIHFSG